MNPLQRFQYLLILLIGGTSMLWSCNKEDDLQKEVLYVDFVGSLADTSRLTEGTSLQYTLRNPSSVDEDLSATLSFTGTAQYGTDFTLSGSAVQSANASGAVINIPADIKQSEFTIELLADGEDEIKEYLTITLDGATSSSGKVFGSSPDELEEVNTTIAIENTSLVLGFSPATLSIREDDAEDKEITLSINYPLATALNIDIQTTTSMNASEYLLTGFSDRLSIPAGETQVSFSVRSVDDGEIDSVPDSIEFEITAASAASGNLDITLSQAHAKIMVEDDLVKINLPENPLTLTDIGAERELNVPVQLSEASASPITLNYTIAVSNGAQGTYYQDNTAGSVTFAAGELLKNIVVTIEDEAFTCGDVVLDISTDDDRISSADAEVITGTKTSQIIVSYANPPCTNAIPVGNYTVVAYRNQSISNPRTYTVSIRENVCDNTYFIENFNLDYQTPFYSSYNNQPISGGFTHNCNTDQVILDQVGTLEVQWSGTGVYNPTDQTITFGEVSDPGYNQGPWTNAGQGYVLTKQN